MNIPQFAIDEIAIINNPDSPNHNKEVTVLSLPHEANIKDMYSGRVKTAISVKVEPGPGCVLGPYYNNKMPLYAEVKYLRKRPYKDYWKDCIWQPTQATV